MDLFLPTLLNWCRKCALYGPAFGNAPPKDAEANPNFVRPIGKAHCLPVKGDKSIRASISGLLFWGSPTTVCRLVAFRAVDSVIAMRWRRFRPHVGVEVFKRFPSLAYCDSLCAVSMEGCRVRIVASFIHFCPRNIFWCATHSVLSRAAACLATVATVRIQTVSRDLAFCSALAETDPVDISRWMIDCFFDYRPLTESPPSQVFEVVGATSRIAGSHDFVPIKQVVVRTARRLESLGCSHFSTSVMGGL